MQIIKQNTIRSFMLFSALIATAPSILAQQSTLQIHKGVIIDTNKQQVFVINKDSGIDAIAVENGSIKWHSNTAELPLTVSKSNLIATANGKKPGELRLYSLNASTGQLIESKSIPIIQPLLIRIADGLDYQFKIKAIETNKQIQWQHKYQKTQGMLSDKSPETKIVTGAINLSTDNALNSLSNKTSQARELTHNKTVEGHFLNGMSGRQFKSISGQFILVSNRHSDVSLWNKYKWDLYNLNGTLLGSMDSQYSYRPFVIADDTLLYVSLPYIRYTDKQSIDSPLKLMSFSLITGINLWNHPIRDLSYRGPYPQ